MKIIVVIAIAFSFIMPAKAQTEEKNAQAVVSEFFEALSAMDPKLIDPLVTGDFVLLEMGEVWNADSLKKRMVLPNGIDFKRTNLLEFIKTDVGENIAWISYHNKAEIKWNNSIRLLQWLESAVLVKEDGRWKISLLHSTKVDMKVDSKKY